MAFFLGLAIGCGPHVGRAAEQPAVIPVTPYLDAVPSVEATAAGEPRRFLFDTAAGVTVATPAIAEQIGCTPWGRITGHRMRGERVDAPHCDEVELQLQGVSLQVPSLLIWDLSKLLPENAPPLAGVLALDAFGERAITLDLAAGQLILETADSLAARVRGATEVPVRFAREAQGLALVPFVPVQTDRGRVWLELDSGSDGALVIGRHVAGALGLHADGERSQPAAFELVGGIEVQAQARVEDLIISGNIGVPVLKQWAVTIDLGNERLWIAPRTPADEPARPLAKRQD